MIRITSVNQWLSQRVPDGLIRVGSLGMVDQAVVSGANFLMMVLAARQLGPSAFGVFALLLTVLHLMHSCQSSLITAPHNVFGVSQHGEDYDRYTSTVAVLQIGMALALSAAVLSAAGIAFFFDTALAWLLLAMTVSAIGWQCHEFMRRVLYTETRIGAALLNDSFSYGLRVLILAVLVINGGLTGENLFVLMGVTWIAGTALGYFQMRARLRPSFSRQVLTDHWEFGRWLFASGAVSHVPRYLIAAVLSAVLSVAAYGAYRAFEQLVNGAHVPLQAISSVLRPRLARDAQIGPQAVWKTMLPVLVVIGASLAIFAGAVVLLRETLVGLIFGAEYAPYTVMLILLAIVPLTTLARVVLSNALQAVRETRLVFTTTVIGTSIGSVTGVIAVVAVGLPVAGAITLFSGIAILVSRAFVWQKILRGARQCTGRSEDQPTATPVVQYVKDL